MGLVTTGLQRQHIYKLYNSKDLLTGAGKSEYNPVLRCPALTESTVYVSSLGLCDSKRDVLCPGTDCIWGEQEQRL